MLIVGIITFLSSHILVWAVIILSKRSGSFQPIHELTPEGHKTKAKTPTLGGIALLISISNAPFVYMLITDTLLSLSTAWLLVVVNSFAYIGLIDDLLSLSSKKNKGLSARMKFLLQWVIACILVGLAHVMIFPLNPVEWLIYAFLFVASSNACNLTDGLDGLLGGCAMISVLGFFLIFSNTLAMSDASNFTLYTLAAIGGFLLLNLPKAKCFMGDTGSLQIGAILAGFTLLSKNPYILLGLGVVYVVETLSVMIQVASFKLTGKRVFLMSPLHHHFELLGLGERSIILIFYIFAAIGFVITMWFYGAV